MLFLGGGCISAVNTSDDPLPYKTSVIDDPYLILKRNFSIREYYTLSTLCQFHTQNAKIRV